MAAEGAEPRGMDPPAFEDRHSFLHPQHGPRRSKVAEDEAGPAGIAGRGGEEFGQDRARWLRHRSGGRRHVRTSLFSRAGTPAGDEMKTSFHTTRNAHVLLLFLFARVREQSQSGDSTSRPERCELGLSARSSLPVGPRDRRFRRRQGRVPAPLPSTSGGSCERAWRWSRHCRSRSRARAR